MKTPSSQGRRFFLKGANMGWAIYIMASLALLAVSGLVRLFCVKRVLAGVMVNVLWLIWAGYAFWSFEAPFEMGPGGCATGWFMRRVGAPLAWRNPLYAPSVIQFTEHADGSGGVAVAAAGPLGSSSFGDTGPLALNLLLWSLPILAFWFILLRRSPGGIKAKRK